MIGKHLDITSGFAFKSTLFNSEGKGMPLIRIRDVGQNESSTFYNGDYDERYVIKKGDFLVGMDGEFRLSEWNGPDSLLNQRVCKLEPDALVIDRRYLYHILPAELKRIEDTTSFVTVKHLSVKKIREIDIPLPPLATQKKIAAILDAADAHRQKTKQLLAKYDELAQSIFLDMFGDPVTNPKGWQKKPASEFYEVRGRVGWKGYKKTDLRNEGAIVLGATHISQSGEIDLEKVVYLSDEKYIESPEIMVKKNDLIFVQRGNTIGKVALVREALGKATINPVVLIFRPIKSNPFFLLYLLMSKELNREFVNSNSGSAQPMITQKTMKEYFLIDVPNDKQDEFGEKVQIIEAQKARAQKGFTMAEDLFNSLLQKAFKGGLVD